MDLLTQMNTFVRVVEAGSLTAAARQLRLSTASVSRQLAALEVRVGKPLAVRTTRSLVVTEEGERYYQSCLRVLREIDQAHERVREGPHGLLTVSAPVTFGLARVVPLMPSLLARHKGLRIDLRIEDRLVDLPAEAVDVAVRVGIDPPDSTSLAARPLLSYERVVVAAPAYLEERGAPDHPRDLARHDLLVHLCAHGGSPRWRLSRAGESVDVEGSGFLRSNALYAVRDAAMRGAGIALLPEWLVHDDIARGALRVLLPAWSAPRVQVLAVHRAQARRAPAVRAFIDHLARALPRGRRPRWSAADRGRARDRPRPRSP